MKNTKKLALAVLVAIGASGCASMQGGDLAKGGAVPAQALEKKVLRAMPSYGSMGGYRYRRFAAVAAAN